ncbi:MAG: C4-type zinc ribbon domain-containing protein, partial [Acidobacteriota bacterium]
DAKLAAARQAFENERQLLTANQAARRDIEKDLAAQQARLSKFRSQLMDVKTNREYQAMQKEIEVAQHEVRKFEDRLLERMLEHDEVEGHLKAAERALTAEQAVIEEERRGLAAQLAEAQASLVRVAAERETVAARISPPVAAIFERVMKSRRISAVAPLQDGRCSACQVRVRPQVYNELRRNEIVFQCESCQRILYHPGPPAPPAA